MHVYIYVFSLSLSRFPSFKQVRGSNTLAALGSLPGRGKPSRRWSVAAICSWSPREMVLSATHSKGRCATCNKTPGHILKWTFWISWCTLLPLPPRTKRSWSPESCREVWTDAAVPRQRPATGFKAWSSSTRRQSKVPSTECAWTHGPCSGGETTGWKRPNPSERCSQKVWSEGVEMAFMWRMQVGHPHFHRSIVIHPHFISFYRGFWYIFIDQPSKNECLNPGLPWDVPVGELSPLRLGHHDRWAFRGLWTLGTFAIYGKHTHTCTPTHTDKCTFGKFGSFSCHISLVNIRFHSILVQGLNLLIKCLIFIFIFGWVCAFAGGFYFIRKKRANPTKKRLNFFWVRKPTEKVRIPFAHARHITSHPIT